MYVSSSCHRGISRLAAEMHEPRIGSMSGGVWCAHSMVCNGGNGGKEVVLVCAVGNMKARLIGR